MYILVHVVSISHSLVSCQDPEVQPEVRSYHISGSLPSIHISLSPWFSFFLLVLIGLRGHIRGLWALDNIQNGCTWSGLVLALGLAWCWPGVGPGVGLVLAWCWPGVGLVLAWCWPGVDLVLAWCWPGVDLVLAWCWTGLGLLLAWCWPGVDLVLAWCWTGLGLLLAWYWPGWSDDGLVLT
jgi:hypothetical protein